MVKKSFSANLSQCCSFTLKSYAKIICEQDKGLPATSSGLSVLVGGTLAVPPPPERPQPESKAE